MAEVQGQRDPQQDDGPEAKKNFFQRMSTTQMILASAAGGAMAATGTLSLMAGAPILTATAPLVLGAAIWSSSALSALYKEDEANKISQDNSRLRDLLTFAQNAPEQATGEKAEASTLKKAVEYLSGVRDRLQTEFSHLMGEKNTVEEQLKQSMEQLRQSRESEKILAAKVESLEVQLGERGPAPGEPQQHQDASQAAKVSRGGLNP